MSAREEVLAHLSAPMFKTEPAALALLDAYRAEVLREAAARQRAAIPDVQDSWTGFSDLVDVIDPDKHTPPET